MSLVAAIILPVFGFILAGFIPVKLKLLPMPLVRVIGGFVYWVAIPVLLFDGMAVHGPHLAGHLGILCAFYGGAFGLFAAALLIARFGFGHDLQHQGVVAINASFGNVVQIGIPLVFAAFGPSGLATLTLIVAFHAMSLLTLGTLVVEWGRASSRGLHHTLGAAARAMALNPVIIAIVLGFLWSQTGWSLPLPLAWAIDRIAAIAGPAALFAAGATLTHYRLGERFGESLLLVALKIVALPLLVFVLASFVFRLAPLDTAIATLAAGLPIGSNAFILAERYRIYEARTAAATLFSNIGALATLTILVALLV